jgi:NCS1 family nucleobase:cation symporter-1
MTLLQARIRLRIEQTGSSIKQKRHVDGWVLPKESTSFAPEGTWTNVDLDVTPLDRQIWTPLLFLGYWISDIVG